MRLRTLYILCLATAVAALWAYFFWDIPVATYFFSVKNSSLGKIIKPFSGLGRGEWYLIPPILIAIVFWKKNRPVAHKALFIFTTVAVSGILVNVVKLITRRVRPTLYFSEGLYGFNFYKLDSDFMSFPSGHSATSLGAMVALGFLFPVLRVPFLILGMALAFTRLFLTNHFLSDVLVGAMLGAATSVLLYHHYYQERIDPAAQAGG
jgi:membrane-associated phospholipid phosphatase